MCTVVCGGGSGGSGGYGSGIAVVSSSLCQPKYVAFQFRQFFFHFQLPV